ncbi:MAG: helix-turn-helix transcriptional regulator [Candidatus Nitrosocosmicus sp.]|nr:helix-turn-helix transcriptional regulator [Candidatus Nitrosocosmicus sp.]
MKTEKLIGDKLPPTRGKDSKKLHILDNSEINSCNFYGYNIESLMKETSELRNIITKRGTLEILMPLCCSTDPVRYLTFKNSMKGFSSKTLTTRLRELEKSGILNRQYFNEIPPRVEYRLTPKGQELVESIINLLQWMRKWSNK